MKKRLIAFLIIAALSANSTTTALAADTRSTSIEVLGFGGLTGVIDTAEVSNTEAETETMTTTSGDTTIVITEDKASADTGMDTGIDSISAIITETGIDTGNASDKAGDTTQAGFEIASDSQKAFIVEDAKKEKEKANNAEEEKTSDLKQEIILVRDSVKADFVEASGANTETKEAEKKEEKASTVTKEQQAIIDYAKSIGYTDGRRWDDTAVLYNHEYAEEPVIGETACEAGKLSDKTLLEGLNLINLIRKTAGLGEVKLSDTYNEYAQHGALNMAASGDFSHYPDQANNLTDEQFALGMKGTTRGNIGKGYRSLTDSILNGYMYDGDFSNISAMGHRRWILNPTMGEVGFGQVGEYNDMYAHDNSVNTKLEDFIAWPAQNMPVELMPYVNTDGRIKTDTPWTCQIGNNYKIVAPKDLTITVTDSTGKTITIPVNNIYTNKANYGYTNGCITFASNSMQELNYSAGQTYTVKIDGVLDSKTGKATTIEYDVNFFSLGL